MALDPDKFKPMVTSVARSVSSNYPPYVTREDTEQALYLWLYEKRASVLQTVEDSPDDWEAKIASTMRKVAFDHCAREKASAEGYAVEDMYRYSLPKIKSLLPDVFNYNNWQVFGTPSDMGQPRASRQANQTGDRMVEIVDVKAAIERLNTETRMVLFFQYALNYTMEGIADAMELSPEAAKKRSQRALGAIQRELGRKDPDAQPKPSDRRTVKSNSAWRSAQAHQYEG